MGTGLFNPLPDRDQHELQFLGLLGVYSETSKIITLALILPLCVVFLAHSAVSQLLCFKIPRYRDLSRMLKKEWVAFWLFQLGYFIFVFIFSLLLTSAVVHTVACIYVAKQIPFKNIMSVVPRVWKRLMVLSSGVSQPSVLSVLEDVYGWKAMVKSKRLIKGKMGMSVGCFLGVLVWFTLVQALFECFVVFDLVLGIGIEIGVGLICLLLLLMVVLFYLVVQTVIYFVCKSYHHENIDKSSSSDHLEVYLGYYVPLKPNAVQLEQLHV
ncbi:hypothetical protein BT93_I0096 [Corymbia citriodora subsp. variegata]|nr:hypothetical protein BT93_I0096 [Corymbia citriodora subsp. variegata]